VSGTKFLLDTNVVLYLLSGDKTVADLLNDKQLYISFITELELLGYAGITKKEHKAIRLFLQECAVINITEQIKEETIRIRQTYKVKLPDSIIAATSQYLGIPLITADQDFKRIENIDVLIYEVQE